MGPASSPLLASILIAIATSITAAPSPSGWEPAKAPPPTAWARAGARSWRTCDALGHKALQTRLVRSGAARLQDRTWRLRMERCPGEPEVLVLAAQEQILESARMGWLPEDERNVDDIAVKHKKALVEAVAWVDRSLDESARRGDAEPFEARYLRAYALMALGRYREATADLSVVRSRGDVERWRLERMAAVAAVFGGDLDQALTLALRSLVDAPPDDTMISRYVWAMVLDRAGAQASATAEFVSIHEDPGHTQARQGFESFLPTHERLYLRALEHQANGEKPNAIRLWDAYLARPEPEDADRILAERHRAEL